MIDRMEQNSAIVAKYLNEPDFQRVVFDAVVKRLFEEIVSFRRQCVRQSAQPGSLARREATHEHQHERGRAFCAARRSPGVRGLASGARRPGDPAARAPVGRG
ncbi:MAG: hypothetical protein JW751_08475, partial [Polyangiaceae bacterium]|nr:hypothetical protein [Polyangiaceae bacterium]